MIFVVMGLAFLGHPAKVARTEVRIMERQVPGTVVKMECVRIARYTDSCNYATRIPPLQFGPVYTATAHIAKNGNSYTMTWS